MTSFDAVRYDKESGLFFWVKPTNRRIRIGSIAGATLKGGYKHISINNKKYLAHRLAWFIFYGKWPDGEIDHINGNPADNRIENLRDVSHTENIQNIRAKLSNNKSGFLGVFKRAGYKRWTAQISLNNKLIYLGNFKTPEEAHRAYIEAKRKLHPTCTI